MIRTSLPFATLLGLIAVVGLQPTQGEEPLQYNKDIRPILADHCFACHGPDSASRKADLRLDQREAAVDELLEITDGIHQGFFIALEAVNGVLHDPDSVSAVAQSCPF